MSVVKKKINGIKKIIAISSAKGGVGKSTICANLACATSKLNLKVGILDADIYGPSIPQLFSINEKPITDGMILDPIEKYNLQLMSIGFLVDQNVPMIWRGPMVSSAIKTFTNKVRWKDIDVLFIDMPPGTGDALLTFSQEIQIDGAIIITTPQKLSVNDANRGIEMFKKLNVPIFGIIENMSYIKDQNNSVSYPFGKDGALSLTSKHNLELLANLEINDELSKSSDVGIPLLESDLNSEISKNFLKIAEKIKSKLYN